LIERRLALNDVDGQAKSDGFRQRALLVACWILSLAFVLFLVPVIGLVSDFASDLYPAAWSALHGHGIYSAALTQASAGNHPGAYAIPPVFALALAPFALLPFSAAAMLWYVLNLIFLAGAALVAGRLWAPGRNQWLASTISLAVFAGFGPLIASLALGQLDILLLLLTLTGLALLRSGSQGWAGLILGLATVGKIYPFGIVVYCALHRQFRVVFVALCTIVSSVAIAVAVLGSKTATDYLRLIQLSGKPGWIAHPSSFSFVSFLYRAFTPTNWAIPLAHLPSGLIRSAYVLIALAVAGAVGAIVLKTGARFSFAPLSLVACSTLLLFPFLNDGHLLLLLAVLPGLAVSLGGELSGRVSSPALKRLALFGLFTTLVLAIGTATANRFHVHHTSVMAGLILLAALGVMSREIARWEVTASTRIAVIGMVAAYLFLAAPNYIGINAWGGVPISRLHVILGESQLALLALLWCCLAVLLTARSRWPATTTGLPSKSVVQLAEVDHA
jgi:hypothetical protein